MELRHLRTIAAVAHHRSFTRAAEELHLAQSAISQQIRRLETELGVEVFRRSSRSVEVTPEGRLLVEHAHRVLAEVDQLPLRAGGAHGLLTGRVAIGGMYPTGPYDIPDGPGRRSAPATPASRSTWSRTPPTRCSPCCATTPWT